MRRTLLLLPVLLLFASTASAVTPQFWSTSSADEFLAGEIEGFAVTARGELRAAPAARKIASFTDPFVLAQAAGSGGDRYFGTGNDGRVYRLRGENLTVVFTAPEPEVYAVAFSNGVLYAGTSPNGKIYRIDPAKGTHTVLFDPEQAYIWSIVPLANGELAVATGIEGKLFLVSSRGEGRVLYDAPDTHIRSVAELPGGALIAGAASRGRIYRVERSGSAHALLDSPLTEITAVHVGRSGEAWAAAVTSALPSVAPAKAAAKTQPAADAKKDAEKAPAAEVSFSFDDPAAAAPATSGASELYRIEVDGFVTTVRKFEREMIYALGEDAQGRLVLATGPNGRLYRLENGELALLATVPEKQVVSISGGERMSITTTNAGAVYELASQTSGTHEFRSIPRDTERFSRFGEYRVEGSGLAAANVSLSFRSGNTRTPDATWSNWSAPLKGVAGTVSAPAARYLQWKLTMANPTAAVVDSVSVSFANRNVAPSIESVTVQDPAVVFVPSGYAGGSGLVDATNPDQNGIFTTIGPANDRSSDPGRRVFRKGFRTVMWRATDENGDALRYTVEFRPQGGSRWLLLRGEVEEAQMNFDTSQLPDGLYELRLTASDAKDNPESALTGVREGIEFRVDNMAPRIAVSEAGDDIMIEVHDQSPIGRVEYAVDAERWTRLTPVDGIADSTEETFRLKKSEVTNRFVIVRALDIFYNVATSPVQR